MGSQGMRVRAVLFAATVGVTLLVCGTTANAGIPGATQSLGKSRGLQYFKAGFANVVTQVAQPANCDGDAEVTGGGGAIGGPPAQSALNESYPLEGMAGHGWQAEGTSTGAPRRLTSYAVCGPVNLDHVVSQTALPENAVSHALRPCDPAQDVIGGGAAASGPGIRVIASTPSLPPSTTGWLSSAFNPTIDDTLFDYYAICGGDYEFRYRRSDPVRVRAGESGKAVATCKKKEAVLGGGFEVRRGEVVGYRAHPSVTKPWDSKDRKKVPDDGWLVKASNPIETFRVDLVAIAVCKRPA